MHFTPWEDVLVSELQITMVSFQTKTFPSSYPSVFTGGQDQPEIICLGSLAMFAQCLLTLHLDHTNTMSYLLSLSLDTFPKLERMQLLEIEEDPKVFLC